MRRTLAVTLATPSNNPLAEKRVVGEVEEALVGKKLEKATSKMFKDFPPSPGKK